MGNRSICCSGTVSYTHLVREMAGGFSTFINDGVFAGTRTYTKVLDSEGNVVLENNPGTELGFENVRTAYYMLD